jgi:serine/threonine protein kinase
MRRLLNTSSQSSSSAISSLLNTPPTPFQNQYAPPLFGVGAQHYQHQPHPQQHQQQQQQAPAATTCTKGDKNNSNNYSLSTQTPTHQNLSSSSDPYGSFFKKIQPYHTGSTGVTHLETTFEADGDSVDTNSSNNNNSPARFRFTSFPASLPRVHHANHYPRSTPPVCPGSVRKRMSFDTEDDDGVAENPTNNTSNNVWKGNHNENDTDDDDNDNNNDNDKDNDNDPVGLNYSNHQHDAINQSRDDDGTHNTSLSSLSVEGGHHQHLPHLPHQHPAHFASAPSKNLLLFPGEQQDAENDNGNNNSSNTRNNKPIDLNNNLLGYSDDDDEDDDLPPTIFGRRDDLASPDQGAVRRTRLNFNVFLSPTNTTKKSINRNSNSNHHHHNTKENEFGGGRRMDLPPNNVDLSRPYESQNRMNSFHSSISSQTQLNNSSTHTNEDSLIVGTSSSSPSLTPPRTVLKNNCNPPKTPHEVHLHFPLESECSPILGVPKQEFGDTAATMLDRRPQQLGGNNPSAVASSSAATTSLLGNNRFGVANKSTLSSPSHSAYSSSTKLRSQQQKQKEEANNSSISSSSESSSTATQKRRLRPMPDMSAFETVKRSSSVRTHRTLDDGATAGDVLRVMPMPSLKIRRERERPCPPTPQRTPAWANEGGSHVFNSLISNKVLLSCPSQVLEGRCSLETSVLDEDSKASGSRRNSFSNSYDRSISANKNHHALSHGNDEDDDVLMDVDHKCGDSVVGQSAAPVLDTIDKQCKAASRVQITAPPKLMRRLPSNPDTSASVSFSGDFEILGSLGSGAFADVYKVRLKSDNQLYAVKRNRRQFRGKRDRDVALAEVQSMQRLQSVFATHNASGDNKKNEENNFKSISSEYNRNCYSLYLLFFYRAWQQDGYFYSQTELCCRDTCREMLDSLRFLWNSAKKKYPSLVQKLPPPAGVQAGSQLDAFGRLVPNMSVWKICHDISAGLSHIHSHGIVHQDIKPSNIFFVTNARFGAMCKIGDFGLAGSIGSSGDGQEGDTRYLPPELLASATRHTSSDIFSLGLTLYEIATDEQIEMPSEGQRWHQLRSSGEPTLPACRGENLQRLLQAMTDPDERNRPTADTILNNENVKAAGNEVDTFLQDYIKDIEEYDRLEEERLAIDRTEDQTPRNGHRHTNVRSPSLSMLLPPAPNLFSPQAKIVHS